MGDGCLPPEEIDALLAGRLDDAAIERVEGHIDGCASCRQLIGQLAGDSIYDRASLGGSATAATLATDGASAPANTLADDEPPPRPSIRRLRPLRIGRYLVERRLGAGGMGVVYLADDPELKRKVVIKLLRAEASRVDNSTRLVREAQAMAKVSHANVVPVFDVGVHDGQVFLAMEFIDGADLAAWLGQPRGVREVLDVFVAAGRGLAAAHRAGLVHRDFKPHNVMLGKTGEVKVTDFGLARAELAATDADPLLAPVGADSLLDSPLTRSGALIGTPAYMPPEQIRGEPVDARSDQFSFCVALYEALFGERPFAGKTMTELFESTLEGSLPPSITKRRGVPARVRDAIRRGLRVSPGERFPSMEALLAELAPRASRRAVIAATVAGLALAAVVIIALLVARDRPAEALCSGGAGELAGVWHPARRQAIEAAFLATRARLAPAAFGAMATAIDRYAATWRAGHRAACEATRVRGEQTEQVMDQRLRCLRRRRAELDALLGVLAAPDDDLMANVTAVVGRLVDPASCGNLEAIASATPPVDPGKRAAVEALEGELAKSLAQIAANRTEAARRRLTAALATAEQVGHKPLVAELHLELGVALLEDNDWADAERELHRAVEIGEEAGADAVRARAFVHLVYVATTVGKLDEAERWARYAQATAERLGNDRRLLAELDLKLAGIQKARGNARQAEVIYLRAIERMSAEYGPRSRDVALARRELGVHYEQIRNYEGAFAQFEATRDIMAAVFGPGNAESVASIGMMAAVRYDQQKYDEALVLGDQELAATARYFGDDHPMTAASYQAHAMRLQGVGRHDEAIAMMQKSAAIMRARYGENHELHAGVLGSLAVVYSNLGRNDDAFATWSRALDIYVAIYGEAHADSVSLMNALGTIRKRQQRYDEAAALFARARAALAKFQQPGSTLVADTLTRIGSLELLRKRYPAALAALEEALRARIAASAEPASMSWTKLELAQALWHGKGDRARAGKLAREAEAEARAADDRQQLELVAQWLAAHPG